MEIYYEKSGQKVGPVKITDLKPNSLNQGTLVWHKELDNWIKAEELPELDDYFKSIPPPLPTEKKQVIKEVYDDEHGKETEATMLGILIICLSIAIYFVRVKLLPDTEKGYFLAFGILVKVSCAIYAGKIAKELNRNQGGWFILTLFPTAISLIVLGQLPKLNERRISDFERELDKVNEEESL